MRRYVVRRDRMSGGVAPIGIALHFQQRFRESAVRLVHPHEFRQWVKRARTQLEVCAFFRHVGFDAAASEDIGELYRVQRRLDQKTKQLARSARTHRFFPDRIKVLQPLCSILRSVPQQQKRRGRHVVCDVA